MYCTQCEAQGFRKITYWPDRPDVMTTFRVRIEGDGARAAFERQPGRVRSRVGGVGGPVPQAFVSLRPGRGRPRGCRGPLRHAFGTRDPAADLGPAGGRGPLRLRHGRAEAGDGLGRARIRARVRPRPVHDRGGRRLQHGGDGEQGAQRLQLALRAGEPGDGDRRRLQVDRDDHRARVFPQLDRQPHHLPRLVPALPQGGADGLSRPAVLGRPAERGGEADRGRAASARSTVPRGCRAPRAPGPPGGIHRDQQLLYRDGLREGRRGHRHASSPRRPRNLREGARRSISSGTTARPAPSRTGSRCSRTPRAAT